MVITRQQITVAAKRRLPRISVTVDPSRACVHVVPGRGSRCVDAPSTWT
jgi:hypothetical protein